MNQSDILGGKITIINDYKFALFVGYFSIYCTKKKEIYFKRLILLGNP